MQAQAISYTTGVPAMIGAMMMLTGKWKGDGVFNMEQFDPDPFMDELNKHGLPWTVIELDQRPGTEPRPLHARERFRPLRCAPRADALLRRRRVGARGATSRARRRPARERREDPARAQGVLDVRASRRWCAIPRRHLRQRPARGAARARGVRRRGPRLLRRPTPRRDLRRSSALRPRRVQLARAVAPASAPLVRGARGRPELALRPARQSGALRGRVPLYDPCAPGSRLGIPRCAVPRRIWPASAACTSTPSANRTSRRSRVISNLWRHWNAITS